MYCVTARKTIAFLKGQDAVYLLCTDPTGLRVGLEILRDLLWSITLFLCARKIMFKFKVSSTINSRSNLILILDTFIIVIKSVFVVACMKLK